jgi:hypothetical protein
MSHFLDGEHAPPDPAAACCLLGRRVRLDGGGAGSAAGWSEEEKAAFEAAFYKYPRQWARIAVEIPAILAAVDAARTLAGLAWLPGGQEREREQHTPPPRVRTVDEVGCVAELGFRWVGWWVTDGWLVD